MTKIAGMLALKSFPMAMESVNQLYELCDKVFLRYDAVNGDPALLQQAKNTLADKCGGIAIANGWGHPQWREDCLRMLDEYAPDIVLCPDEDELFDDTITEELKQFWFSDKKGMMFSYFPLVSADGRVINNGEPYPPVPHMKAFKWEKGLSYYPYHGNAVISKYCNANTHWQAKTKIKHYSAFTIPMELSKHWKSNTPHFKGVKAVTLLGFGPSAGSNMEAMGEIWSVNNCYEVLSPEQMKRVTRIYEMHKFGDRSGKKWDDLWKRNPGLKLEDRNKMKSGDGRLHTARLDEIARQGRKIIMQEPHASISNSESYPIDEIVRITGVDWFMGTPCYMVAQAILEGYTHIRVWGMDQLDYEHTLQRDCFAGWMMYAVGRGIQISGALTWLKDIDRRYGYDFGPEFDNWCEDLLWRGHPMQVHYKIPSRAIKGELCEKIGG